MWASSFAVRIQRVIYLEVVAEYFHYTEPAIGKREWGTYC